jgi:hypothetical protein
MAAGLPHPPVRFTGQKFILPNTATHVLIHPDFATRDATIRQSEDGKSPYAEFRSGPHTLIAKEIEGNVLVGGNRGGQADQPSKIL